jgi:hypothetical protein
MSGFDSYLLMGQPSALDFKKLFEARRLNQTATTMSLLEQERKSIS